MVDPQDRIEFDLLGNAADSIEQAVELLAWGDSLSEAKRLKQAIMSVAHGVELLLKERLRRVHPSLVWENVDKYPSLDARTVGVDTAVRRLSSIGGIQLREADIRLVKSLRDTRNAIEHFSWSTSRQEANLIVGRALSFALAFAKDHLDHEFFGYWSRRDDTLDQLLSSNPAFAKAYTERHELQLKGDQSLRQTCKFCHALAVDLAGGACKFCGHWHALADDDLPF